MKTIIKKKYPIIDLFNKIDALEIKDFKEVLELLELENIYQLNEVYGAGAIHRFKIKFGALGLSCRKIKRTWQEIDRDVAYLKKKYSPDIIFDWITEGRLTSVHDLSLKITGVPQGMYLLRKIYAPKTLDEILLQISKSKEKKILTKEELVELVSTGEISSAKQLLLRSQINSYEGAYLHYGADFLNSICSELYKKKWERANAKPFYTCAQVLDIIYSKNIKSRVQLERITKIPFSRKEIYFYYTSDEVKKIYAYLDPIRYKILPPAMLSGANYHHRACIKIRSTSSAADIMSEYTVIDGKIFQKLCRRLYSSLVLNREKKCKNTYL